MKIREKDDNDSYDNNFIKESNSVFDLKNFEKEAFYETHFKKSQASELDEYASSALKSTASVEVLDFINLDAKAIKNFHVQEKYRNNGFMNREVEVTFTQERMCLSESLPVPLKKFVMRFGGLCDLICNKVLLEGLLDEDKGKSNNHLRDNIDPTMLNDPVILSSHILDVYSLREKLVAFIFGRYADSIFKFSDQKKLVMNTEKGRKVVNQVILERGLERIKKGEVLKVEVIRKNFFAFNGHSLLIKKIDDDSYLFFDPNSGQSRPLSLGEITSRLNEQLAQWQGNGIHIVKGSTFLERLRQKKITKTAQDVHVVPK